jgi:hypothetical protein
MAILERRVQFKVKSESKYQEWEKVWEDVEARLGGFPPKRHYYLMAGSEVAGTTVWEREWESLAVMEAAYDGMFTDSEAQGLGHRAQEIYDGERIEYYFVF